MFRMTSLLSAIATAVLLLLVAVPLGFIVLQAIFPALGEGSLKHAFQGALPALADPQLLQLTLNTLLLGASVSVCSAIIGVPLGVARAELALSRLWDILLLVPLMIPPFIATLGWILMLQPRGYLQQLTGSHAGPLLFSFPGLVLIMTMHLFPAVYFTVSRSITSTGRHLSMVARVFGASRLGAFHGVTLPLLLPGLTGSMLLVFAATIEEFGTPAALAPQSGFLVLVTAIDHKIADWPIDLSGASVLSIILVLLALTAFLLQHRLLRGQSFVTIGGRAQGLPISEPGWRPVAIAMFSLVVILAVGFPLFAILATASIRTLSGGLSAANLTLRNFQLLFSNSAESLRALTTSFSLGIATAVVTAGLGTGAALIIRAGRLGSQSIAILTALPNAVPGIVVAVGLILAWNQPWLPATVYGTHSMLVLAYSCILLPYPVRYVSASLAQVGPSLEAAARVSGASALTSFRRILLPLLLPGLASAMMLVFAISARELVASLLLSPAGQPTIATFIWRQFEQGSLGLGMAMGTVAIGMTTTLMVFVTAFEDHRPR